MAYIEIKDLHYTYENGFEALKGLNLSIEEGETYGFLGPNGAGKTTTFKILVGLLNPTQGQAQINGRQIGTQEREIYKTVGFMPDMTGFYNDFTIREFLRFFGLCHGMKDKEINGRIKDLLNRFKLIEKENELLGTLSKGQKQKAFIMRTMINDPDVLILDEPASGLDPNSRRLLISILREEGKQGKTIVISSHILPELENLCTSIGILYKGKLIEHGRVGELIAKYQNPVATYQINILEGMDFAQRILQGIDNDKLHGFKILSEKILEIEYNGDEHEIANLLEMLVKGSVRITCFEMVEKDIETIYGEILNE